MFGYTIVKKDNLQSLRKSLGEKLAEIVTKCSEIKELKEHNDLLEKENIKILKDNTAYSKWLNWALNQVSELTQQNTNLEDDIEDLSKKMETNEERLENFNQIQDVEFKNKYIKGLKDDILIEIIQVIQVCQNSLLKWSTKIRKIEGLAYRDGASDFADILKKNFKILLTTSASEVSDPLSGEKIERKQK